MTYFTLRTSLDITFTQVLQLEESGTEELRQFAGVINFQPTPLTANWFCTEEMNEIQQF